MRISSHWLMVATVAVFVFLAIGVGVSLSTGSDRKAKGAAAASPPSRGCATTLLKDWTDGRIDGTYPIACYRSALKALPADLQLYSSAGDDISQALSQRIVQGAQKISGHQGVTSVRKAASARRIEPSRSSSTRPARKSSRKVKAPR
jgi:hypothetical protein